MAGLQKAIYPIIALCLSFFTLVTVAQSNDSRIERATLSDNALSIQVSVPRGRTIEDANLRLAGNNLNLSASPVSSDVTLWLLVDRSEAVVNVAPSILTGINRFIDGFDDETNIGIILYSNDTSDYIPSSNRSELEGWLSTYSGRANTSNCINTALDTIQEQLREREEVQRILIVTGELTRQGACPDDTPDLNVPVDLIVIADTVNPLFEDLQDRFGGRLLRANLQTIGNRLDEIKSLWSNPVYELTSDYADEDLSGELELDLSDGTTITLDVSLEQVLSDTNEQASTGALTSLGSNTATEVPTNTQTDPEPTQQAIDDNDADNPSPTERPTENTTVVIVTETEASTDNTVVATEADVVVVDEPSDEQVVVIAPTSIPDDNNTVADTGDDTANNTPETAEEQPSSEETSEPPLILLIGSLIFVLIAGIISYFVIRKPASDSNTTTSPINGIENSVLDPIIKDDTFDMTEMLDVEDDNPPGIDEPDEFEITEIVTEEELRASSQETVALLRDESTGKSYEIYKPESILGRKDTCDIVISDDKAISREHLSFVFTNDDRIKVIILTQNPVSINGSFVKNDSLLSMGDKLTLTPNTELILTALELEEKA